MKRIVIGRRVGDAGFSVVRKFVRKYGLDRTFVGVPAWVTYDGNICLCHTFSVDRLVLNALGGLCLGVADAVVQAVSGSTGLNSATAAALVTIDARPGQSVTALAETLQITHSGAVRLVDRLQTADLVRRATGPDGRTSALFVTETGRGTCSRGVAARRAVLEDLTSELEPEERQHLADLVLRLAPKLTDTRTEARHACRLCEHAICTGEQCPVGGHI